VLIFYLQLRQDEHTAEAYWVLWPQDANCPVLDESRTRPRRFDTVSDARAWMLTEHGEETRLGRMPMVNDDPPKDV
jgi:hypothetical protein